MNKPSPASTTIPGTAALARTRGRLRRALGFSLVELAMVLAIVGLIVSGIMLFYETSSEQNRVSDALTETVAIQSAVSSLTAGQPIDTDADWNALLVQSKLLPSKWTYASTGVNLLSNPWRGFTNILFTDVEGGGGEMLVIQYFGLTKQACTAMLSVDAGQYYTQTDALLIAGPPTPAQANQACGGSGGYVWYFFLLNKI